MKVKSPVKTKQNPNWLIENLPVWALFSSLDVVKQQIINVQHSGVFTMWLLGEFIALGLLGIGIFLGLNENHKWVQKLIFKQKIVKRLPLIGIGILIIINLLNPSLGEYNNTSNQQNTKQLQTQSTKSGVHLMIDDVKMTNFRNGVTVDNLASLQIMHTKIINGENGIISKNTPLTQINDTQFSNVMNPITATNKTK